MLYHQQSTPRHHLCKVTEDQLVIIRELRNQRKTYQFIAEFIGVSRSTVHHECKKLGLNKVLRHMTIDLQVIQAGLDAGHSLDKIARDLHVSKGTISTRIRDAGIKRTRPQHGLRAIPVEDREKVAGLVKLGLIEEEIATLYKTTQGTVSDYLVKHNIPASNGRGRTLGRGRERQEPVVVREVDGVLVV